MLEFKLTLDEVDYSELINFIMPYVKWEEMNVPTVLKQLAMSPGASAAISKFLKIMPKDKQDELVIYLIEKNKDRVIAAIHRAAENRNVHVKVADFSVTNQPDVVVR